MAKIALVSDVHLGTRQYGLRARYEDFLSSFRKLGCNISADALVIGGDLFDSPRPDARSVGVAQEVVEYIKKKGIQVMGIDGNHDLSDGGWLRVIGAMPIEEGSIYKIGDVSICGLHYRSGRDLIASLQGMVDRGVKSDILVAHFALSEMNGGGTADTGVQELCPILEQMGVKCVMMGHVHIPDARAWNGILFVNPGSTEMKSSNEPQSKFYFIVDTEKWEAEAVPIQTRKMETVEITGEDELALFRSRLEKEMSQDDSERAFYQVIADDTIDDVYKRLSVIVHDTGALARIVTRSSHARDMAPVVDRKEESFNTLESAIEARFPKDSDEARLVLSMLRSPDPSSVHLIVERFMNGE